MPVLMAGAPNPCRLSVITAVEHAGMHVRALIAKDAVGACGGPGLQVLAVGTVLDRAIWTIALIAAFRAVKRPFHLHTSMRDLSRWRFLVKEAAALTPQYGVADLSGRHRSTCAALLAFAR